MQKNVRRTIANWLASWVKCERVNGLPDYFERVYVLDSARQAMATESEDKLGLETGGVLVGFFDSRLRAAVVTHASGPGPRALHRPTRFERDREFCQSFIDAHAGRTEGMLDFVGEWHKHPEADPRPSPVDQKTYRKLARDPNCHLDQVVVLITGTRRVGRPVRDVFVRVNGFLFRTNGFVTRPVQDLPDEAYGDLL